MGKHFTIMGLKLEELSLFLLAVFELLVGVDWN